MDEVTQLAQTSADGFFIAIDILPAVIAFLTFSVIYFVIPLHGFDPARRGAIAFALYLLIAYVATSILQFLMLAMSLLQKNDPVIIFGNGHLQIGPTIRVIFIFVKMLLMLLAMVSFVIGLRNLRLNPVKQEAHFGGEEEKIG